MWFYFIWCDSMWCDTGPSLSRFSVDLCRLVPPHVVWSRLHAARVEERAMGFVSLPQLLRPPPRCDPQAQVTVRILLHRAALNSHLIPERRYIWSCLWTRSPLQICSRERARLRRAVSFRTSALGNPRFTLPSTHHVMKVLKGDPLLLFCYRVSRVSRVSSVSRVASGRDRCSRYFTLKQIFWLPSHLTHNTLNSVVFLIIRWTPWCFS